MGTRNLENALLDRAFSEANWAAGHGAECPGTWKPAAAHPAALTRPGRLSLLPLQRDGSEGAGAESGTQTGNTAQG
jgi:hypothetical protein